MDKTSKSAKTALLQCFTLIPILAKESGTPEWPQFNNHSTPKKKTKTVKMAKQ